jgi:pimeloyl-ACP methyl ester carboxylesterase
LSAEPRNGSVRFLLGSAFYRMAFTEWGDPSAPPVVCVHGLTRNGRDFDALAAGLADRFRVICPDLPGRGGSDWMPDPMLYQAQYYVAALGHLLAAIGRETAWVGTSLGGICGMLLAAASGSPINQLILNDVGPFIPAAALTRIRDYLTASTASPLTSRFADVEAVERYLRLVHAPFGPLTDAQWAHLAEISARKLPEGGYALHYDPAIAVPMQGHDPVDIDLWAYWERITVPRMALRGESSDLLLPDTCAQMQESGATVLEIKDTGHAPALMDTGQIAAVRAFLTGG